MLLQEIKKLLCSIILRYFIIQQHRHHLELVLMFAHHKLEITHKTELQSNADSRTQLHDAPVELHWVGGGGGGGGGVCHPPRLARVPRGWSIRDDLGVCLALWPRQARLSPRSLSLLSHPRVLVSTQSSCMLMYSFDVFLKIIVTLSDEN